MIRLVFSNRSLFALLCWLLVPVASGADRVRLFVEGNERSHHALIARSIATFIAKPAGIDVEVRYTAGPPATLARLREGSGQQFALLPADVADAYLAAAARGNVDADQLIAPVRVIAPLHDEDIYFMVRSNSPLNYIHEIERARINLGAPGSGSALTVTTLYRHLFNATLPEAQASFHSTQEALVKLTEESVDVVALVSPYPSRLLADMKPEARRFVKLLKFDPKQSGAAKVSGIYSSNIVPAAGYPNLLDSDLTTLSVKTYLASHGKSNLLQSRLASAWCQNLPRMIEQGPLALKDLVVSLPPLVSGWQYARPFQRELMACMEGKRAPPESCSFEDRLLGLCS